MPEFIVSKILGLIPAAPVWYLAARLYLAGWPFLAAVVAYAGLSVYFYCIWLLIVKIENPRAEARENSEG